MHRPESALIENTADFREPRRLSNDDPLQLDAFMPRHLGGKGDREGMHIAVERSMRSKDILHLRMKAQRRILDDGGKHPSLPLSTKFAFSTADSRLFAMDVVATRPYTLN